VASQTNTEKNGSYVITLFYSFNTISLSVTCIPRKQLARAATASPVLRTITVHVAILIAAHVETGDAAAVLVTVA